MKKLSEQTTKLCNLLRSVCKRDLTIGAAVLVKKAILSRFSTCPLCGYRGQVLFGFECLNVNCRNYGPKV